MKGAVPPAVSLLVSGTTTSVFSHFPCRAVERCSFWLSSAFGFSSSNIQRVQVGHPCTCRDRQSPSLCASEFIPPSRRVHLMKSHKLLEPKPRLFIFFWADTTNPDFAKYSPQLPHAKKWREGLPLRFDRPTWCSSSSSSSRGWWWWRQTRISQAPAFRA